MSFYKDVAAKEGMARCRRCDQEYAPLLQINDLIEVERELGYRYETNAPGIEHYQRICPGCRAFPRVVPARSRASTGGSPGEHAAMRIE